MAEAANTQRSQRRFRRAFLAGLKAYPTLLRIGFAEAIAYRAELLVWMLTTTMPLVSMALWSSAAAGQRLGPERMGQAELVGYFTLTLLVRLITSSWVLWQLTEEIRSGTLAPQKLIGRQIGLAESIPALMAMDRFEGTGVTVVTAF